MKSIETIDYNSIVDEKLRINQQTDIPPQTVSGAVIDFEAQRLQTLLISQEGQLRWEVCPNQLADWKEDGITIENQEALKPIQRGKGRVVFCKQNALIGATVTNSRGVPQGKVDNFWFSRTGTILHYVVSRGFLKDLFSGKDKVYPTEVKSLSPRMLVLQY